MDGIKINSLATLKVEQIKITGTIFVGGKPVSATLNKTLDSSIIAQLPPELVGALTTYAFGSDFTSEECRKLAEYLYNVADEKQAEEALEQPATDEVE